MTNCKLNFFAKTLLALTLLAMPIISSSHNKLVVIPLAGNDASPLQNVITVAKQNGDFRDPIRALSSIQDASSDNPYLLVIGPGNYILSQPLEMKKYIHIVGSGRGITTLQGKFSNPSVSKLAATVIGSTSSSMRSLTIENKNTLSGRTIGIYNDAATPFSDLIVRVTGGAGQIGVYNHIGSARYREVSIFVLEGASNTQFGMLNVAASPELSFSKIGVTSGPSSSYGIANYSASKPKVLSSKISATLGLGGGSISYGIYNSSDEDSVRIANSDINGVTNSLRAGSGSGENESYISDSVLRSPLSGDPMCNFVFSDTGTNLDSQC